MNDAQWSSVETYFDALRDLPPEPRAAALNAIADDVVRREVSSLLDHASEGDTIAVAVGAMAAHVDGAALRDQRIGPYRLVRRLGQEATEQSLKRFATTARFHQRVAIKIVKWEMDSDAARARFRAERQIVAGLEHPNIARLLDGGETPDGAPYLVLEFVDGQPLVAATAGWRSSESWNCSCRWRTPSPSPTAT